MPRPVYTAPPNAAPSLGDPDFSTNASGYLGWFPTFGTYVEEMADWYETDFAKELANGTAALPSMAFAGDLDTGLYRVAANTLGFSAGGVKRAQLSSLGFEINVPITGTAVVSNDVDDTAGRLMSVGSFGLGGREAPGISDVDASHPCGFYDTDSGYTGGPVATGSFGDGIIRWERSAGSSRYQIFAPRTGDSDLWFSRKTNATSDWEHTRLYSTANIVGTVSESAGDPTGAGFQSGANANGDWVRLADGTQICWVKKAAGSITANGTGTATNPYRTTVIDGTWPVAFSSDPVVTPGVLPPSDNFSLVQTAATPLLRSATTGSYFGLGAMRPAGQSSTSVDYDVTITAVGRWFE